MWRISTDAVQNAKLNQDGRVDRCKRELAVHKVFVAVYAVMAFAHQTKSVTTETW